MARPKKEKELKHTHRIYLRLTDTEYEIVSTNAQSTNLSLAAYAEQYKSAAGENSYGNTETHSE